MFFFSFGFAFVIILLASIDFPQHLAFFHNIGFFFSRKKTEKNEEEKLSPISHHPVLTTVKVWACFYFYFSSPFFKKIKTIQSVLA